MTQSNSPKPNSSEPHPLLRIADLERKVALLEQRLDKLESQNKILVETSPTKAIISEKTKTEQESKLFEIIKVETRITETNDSWSKVSWKLVLRSFADAPLGFGATIEFLDNDGFIVDSAFQSEVLLPDQNEQIFTGYYLLDASLIVGVASIQAKVRLS